MKKIILLPVLAFFAFTASAQVSSLSENFDVDCVLAGKIAYSTHWLEYNPITTTIDSGAWTCTPTLGRPNLSNVPTPGIMCSGVYAGAYHLDTSFLVTPSLNFTGYANHVYLRFDTKTSKIHLGGNLDVLVVFDSSAYDTTAPTANIDASLSPIFGQGDSTDWVTHEVDLTPYKATAFYIAFRYTSSTTTGSTWYLDNVNTSATRLNVTDIDQAQLPLTIIGASTANNITLSYTALTAGTCNLAISDLMGRVVHRETIMAQSGPQTCNITGLDLQPGMYFLKMRDGNAFGTAKVLVR